MKQKGGNCSKITDFFTLSNDKRPSKDEIINPTATTIISTTATIATIKYKGKEKDEEEEKGKLPIVETMINLPDLESIPNIVFIDDHPFFQAHGKKRAKQRIEMVNIEKDSIKRKRHFDNLLLLNAPLFPSFNYPSLANCIFHNDEISKEAMFELDQNKDSPFVKNQWNQMLSNTPRKGGVRKIVEKDMEFDFDRYNPRINCLFKNANRDQPILFDSNQFHQAIREIIAWTNPVDSVERRAIWFVSGPSGTGKTSLAQALAKQLDVHYEEINAATTAFRNSKPFEDILAGTHQQRLMMRKFINKNEEREKCNNESSFSSNENGLYHIKMVLLIDEVDLCWPCDKFYTGLNNFLKVCSSSILVIMTSSSDPRWMQKFIDFPIDTMFTEFNQHATNMTKEERKEVALKDHMETNEEILLRSDLIDALHWEQIDREYYEDGTEFPTSTIPHELTMTKCKNSPFSYDFTEITTTTLVDEQESLRLLRDLYREGFMLGCKSFYEWILYYLPCWSLLELESVWRNELRVRRTTRTIRPRPYLSAIPESLLNRVRSYAVTCLKDDHLATFIPNRQDLDICK